MFLTTILTHLAYAEISPKEFDRVTNDLTKTLEFFRGFTETRVALEGSVLRRDPTKSLIDASGKPLSSMGLYDGPVLQGIIRSEGFTRVLMNDKLYALGDTIGTSKIREIRNDGIEVEEGNSTIFIPLYSEPQEKKGEIT